MGQEILRQVNWNGGELAPRLHGRRDIKAYYNSAAVIENLVPTVLGPLVRRPGLTFRDLMRHRLEAVDLAGAALAAPSGGNADKILSADGDPLVTDVSMESTDPYVVCSITFDAPVTVHLVDLVDYGVQGPAGGGGEVEEPPVYPPGFPWWDRQDYNWVEP
jgi:hypothetical protein